MKSAIERITRVCGRPANDNRTAERFEAASWAIAIAAMWAMVLIPIAAILWGQP